jgi:hypothetical protein
MDGRIGMGMIVSKPHLELDASERFDALYRKIILIEPAHHVESVATLPGSSC